MPPRTRVSDEPASATTATGPTMVAAIDIGSSAIRMILAQGSNKDAPQTLEILQQPVSLGKDTFTLGFLSQVTIEECVRTLRNFRGVLDQYQLPPEHIHAVATTAVREAGNRDIFLDRIYMTTGLQVDLLEEAEITRLTYLAARRLFTKQSSLNLAEALLVEVGGGSTELIQMTKQRVLHSQSCRLGSLRMRTMLESYDAPVARHRDIMESHIERSLEQVMQAISLSKDGRLVALGGDLRFAASQLDSDWGDKPATPLKVKALAKFTDMILEQSVDQLVARYHITFPEAESLGTALLTHLYIARTLEQKEFLVARATMRDGLLIEALAPQAWTKQVEQQVIQSALDLGRKFHFDEGHGTHVAVLCKTLFHALEAEHQLDPRFELILYVAALLHEVGLFVGNTSHHKHSMYLIRNSELFGLGRKDVLLVALVARYHRRASPRRSHEGYGELDRPDRIAVAKMAAILRLADALDRSHHQHIRNLKCMVVDDKVVVQVPHVSDLTLEGLALKEKGSLFNEIYGKSVSLQRMEEHEHTP